MSSGPLAKTLKDFQQIIQKPETKAILSFESRDPSVPLPGIENHPLSPELIYLYTNYETGIIMSPDIHIKWHRELFPMDYSIDKGKTFHHYTPWKKSRVIIATMGESKKFLADTAQDGTPVYVTISQKDEADEIQEQISPDLETFFRLLIELSKAFTANSDQSPISGADFSLWRKYAQDVVYPDFTGRIKGMIGIDETDAIIRFLKA